MKIGKKVRTGAQKSVWDNVKYDVRADVGKNAGDVVENITWDDVRAGVAGLVWANAWDNAGANVREHLRGTGR